MRFKWKQSKVSPIGIDFGTESIKLIQLEYGDPPRLIAGAGIDIPIDARKDADARQAFITQSLRELLREGKFKGKQAVGCIPASQTYVLHSRVPKGNDEFIENQLEVNLRSQLPIDPTRMEIRHYPICDVNADGQSKQEILCMAATRETVMRHVQAMDQAGLEVAGMHCEPFALVQAFKHLFRRKGDENIVKMYVDIGASMTKVVVTHGLDIVFAKNIQVAGEHFTRLMAKENGIDYTAARLMRIQMALNNAPKGQTDQQSTEHAGEERRNSQTGSGMAEVDNSTENTDQESFTPEEAAYDPTAAFVNEQDTPQHTAPLNTNESIAPATAVQETTKQDTGDRELLNTLIDELQTCLRYYNSLFVDRPVEKLVFVGGESAHVDHCRQIAHHLRLSAQLGDPLSRLVYGDDVSVIGINLNCSQPAWAIPLGLCLLAENA